MYSLMILCLYYPLLILVTWLGWRLAKWRGWGRRGRVLAGLTGFLLIFLPMFWDWIPSKVMYAHYCKTQGGVFQYKTLAQWQAENPGVDLLEPYTKEQKREMYLTGKKPKMTINGWENTAISMLNERLGTYIYVNKLPLSIKKIGRVLVDIKTSEILVEKINFRMGSTMEDGSVKTWLDETTCPLSYIEHNNNVDFSYLMMKFSNESGDNNK